MPEEDKKQQENSPIQTKIVNALIEEEMKKSYLDYAMSVIVGRALPDARDGLKPVHRRILFGMNDLGMHHNKPFKKSARIVGEILGKYHPHGDIAVYDALVRMAQNFSLRYPLIDGQGNFGSVDGDSAAAMRYSEARLKKIAEELLQDIDKETVAFADNFDGSLKEPVVLPAKLPNLLINGSSGIAVGMATNIPPHNINEIIQGTIKVIDNPDIGFKELMAIVKGPDFPTGGIINGNHGLVQAYATGYGKIGIKAKTHMEKKKERDVIIVDEIPYMVNKAQLVEQIAEHVRNKTITGISDLRDESDRDGMRVVIELKKDANTEVVLNQLFKLTRLYVTFGINMLALVDNQPRLLGLKELMQVFISHRKDVVVKRTEFDLRKAQEKAHLLEGLIIALNNIDPVIALIKKASNAETARNSLIANYSLTIVQAQAILDMKLQRLTSLEQNKIKEEHSQLLLQIDDFKDILAKEVRVYSIIKSELVEISKNYGDERKSEITHEEVEEIEIEDLIKPEEVVVTITHSGYVKRMPLTAYEAQRRGGKGVIGATKKEEDVIEHLFTANTLDYLLVFTSKGIVHWLKVYKIPEGSRQAQGKAIINLLPIEENEKISACIPIKKFDDMHYLIMTTRNGVVKKTNLNAYSNPREGGIIALTLDEGDSLVNVRLTDGNKQIIIATADGMAVKFHENDARPIGRTSRGMRGIKLRHSDKVIGMVIADDNKSLLTITENGYGKRTAISDYRLINRGGIGVINIICSERNGKVVSIKSVTEEDEVMFVSQNGIIIRTRCREISIIGRNTQGMRLMKLDEGDKVVAAAIIVAEEGEKIVQTEE